MVEISVSLDTSEVDRYLKQLEANLAVSDPAIATQIANVCFDIIKQWCPSPTSLFYMTPSSGNLRDSHELIPVSSTMWKIRPMAPYAFWVHNGHSLVPHGLAGVQIGKGRPKRTGLAWVPPRPWISDAKGYIQPHVKEITYAAVRSIVASGGT